MPNAKPHLNLAGYEKCSHSGGSPQAPIPSPAMGEFPTLELSTIRLLLLRLLLLHPLLPPPKADFPKGSQILKLTTVPPGRIFER